MMIRTNKKSIGPMIARLLMVAGTAATVCLGVQKLDGQSNSVAGALATAAAMPIPQHYAAYLTPMDHATLNGDRGPIEQTSGTLDLTINGKGFFHVKINTQISDGTAYTRNGCLGLNPNGNLILMIGSGYELVPPINIPRPGTNIAIATDGTVQCQMPGGKVCTCGEIHLSTFDHQRNLSPLGGGFFTDNPSSGPAIVSCPGDGGTGILLQGFLETDVTRESVASLK